MLKKGKWKSISDLMFRIEIFMMITAAALWPLGLLMNNLVPIQISTAVTFIVIPFWILTIDYDEEIDFYLNVGWRSIRTEEAVQSYLVAVHDGHSESVKFKMDEDVYYKLRDTKSYTLTKEGEMAKVLVRLYIDQEGDIIYIKPLQVIGEISTDPITPQTSPA